MRSVMSREDMGPVSQFMIYGDLRLVTSVVFSADNVQLTYVVNEGDTQTRKVHTLNYGDTISVKYHGGNVLETLLLVRPQSSLAQHCEKVADLISSTVTGKVAYLKKLEQDAADETSVGNRCALQAMAQMLALNIDELTRIEKDLRAGLA